MKSPCSRITPGPLQGRIRLSVAPDPSQGTRRRPAKKDLSEAEITWIMSNSRHPRNVPTDAELIAMQRRVELPSDAELARDDN